MNISEAIGNDLIDNNKFEIIDSSIIESEPYANILKDIKFINNKTNWIKNYDDFESRKFEYPHALIKTELNPGMRVADMGCSLDPFLLLLSMKGCKAYGLDIISSHDESWDPDLGFRKGKFTGARKFNEFKKHVKNELKLDINIQIEDMSSTNFTNNYLDRIFCISVLEHLPPHKIIYVLNEWKRILKPKGKIVLTIDYVVNNTVNFNIGEILKKTGFDLKDSIKLVQYNNLIVAAFVIEPNNQKNTTITSKIYRANSVIRNFIDLFFKLKSKL